MSFRTLITTLTRRARPRLVPGSSHGGVEPTSRGVVPLVPPYGTTPLRDDLSHTPTNTPKARPGTSPWTPTHPSTNKAWQAVVTNLEERAQIGMWGSRSIAIALARGTGLTAKRAEDLIASAVRNGYLEERTIGHNGGRQVRLPVQGS